MTQPVTSGRIHWVDFCKGVAAMMVILSHTYTPGTSALYSVGYSFIMIPIFFFASGYLCKFEYLDALQFLYDRVFKLWILYVVYGLLLPFASVSVLKNLVLHPAQILSTFLSAVLNIMTGKVFWFVACLIVVLLLFLLLQIICRGSSRKTLIISAIVGG